MVYLSILRWPADLTKAQRILAAQAAFALDQPAATRIACTPTPTIARAIANPDPSAVRAMIRTLAKVDVHAVAVRDSDLQALPAPIRARSLLPALGAPRPMYAVEPWRGDGVSLVMDNVFLIVRGIVRRSRTQTGKPSVNLAADPFAPDPLAVPGAYTSISADPHGQIIDLYAYDGSCVRIDADKFNFQVLGAQRGLTDRANTESLALRLAREATNAIIDVGFERFDPPASNVRTTRSTTSLDGSEVTLLDRKPLFELYSPWIFLLMKQFGPTAIGPA